MNKELESCVKLLGLLENARDIIDIAGVGINAGLSVDMAISNVKVEIEGRQAQLEDENKKENEAEKVTLTQLFTSIDQDLNNPQSGIHLGMTVQQYLENILSRR